MLVNRQNLEAGVETAFEFDEYAAKSVVVKNETADEILFCDGPFDAAKAAHIPAFSWQSLNVRVFPGETPAFYVKATVSGVVEIDFGPSGMGVLGNVKLSGSNASGYEALTIDNTAGGIACTAAKYVGCRYAFMTLETAQIRFTVDGTAPTTSVGHLLNPGEILKLDSLEDITAFRAIRTGATSGSLRCTYSS